VLGDGADHVEARGLGGGRRGGRIGTAVFRHVDADALHLLGRVEIARPVPGRDGEVDLVALSRNAHHLRAAPGDRAQVGVLLPVLFEHQTLGRVDLGHAVGDLEIEDLGRFPQALRMLGGLEDLAAIGALALEHARSVVEAVGENVELGVLPGYDLPVVPDPSITLIEGGSGHRSSP
jgi:hypothetical protein